MATVLIAYATVEGHTAHIADEMRATLAGAGHDVSLLHVRDAGDELPPDVDAVIVGGPIHVGKHKRELVGWAARHRLRLSALSSGFFTVCLTAADDTEEARATTAEYVQAFSEETGWAPRHTAVFAGRLAWTQYGVFTRVLMKLITRHQGVTDQDVHRDYDYTDYEAVRAFAARVADPAAHAGVA
jgi:menaquinone-dependent protoporphyrinogen oxidase